MFLFFSFLKNVSAHRPLFTSRHAIIFYEKFKDKNVANNVDMVRIRGTVAKWPV